MLENTNFIMQSLYSSKENLKILTGVISAMEIEQEGNKKIECAIVYYKDIKILIPIQEMNIEQDRKYLRNMLGAEIDFIVLEIDELRETAVASRKKAMEIKRQIEFNKYYENDIIKANVISVGMKHIKISCMGVDINLKIDELNYGYIQDVNEFYSVGDKINVKILKMDKETYEIKVSAKELLEDPYKNIRIYYTEGGEYIGKISGFAPNGFYIKLRQGVDAVAIMPIWMSKSPNINDVVSVRIYQIDEKARKIYCSLIRVIKEEK